jgi:glycosyltransferase involved in cell wall biosynthesis
VTEKSRNDSSQNILVLTSWSINDALIQTYTLPYLKLIKKQLSPESSIHLVTMESAGLKVDTSSNITEDFIWLPLPYYTFGLRSAFQTVFNFFRLKKYISKHRINVLHSWCTPAGMMAYLLHKKGKTKFVADSFEPHAHSMVENGTWKESSIAFKILFYFEKKIITSADEIISIAPGMEDFIQKYYQLKRKINFIKPAAVNLDNFSFASKKNQALLKKYDLENKIVMVYAGKFGGIYFNDEIMDFCKACYQFWNDKIRFLFLTGMEKDSLFQMARSRNVPKKNFVIEFVKHSEIPVMMGLADFALCPVKPVPSKKYCSPIKTGEYWALGLPVVIPQNISNDSEIIQQNEAGYVWKAINNEEFEKSVLYMDDLLSSQPPATIYSRIRPLAEKFRNFSIAEKIYQSIYSVSGK